MPRNKNKPTPPLPAPPFSPPPLADVLLFEVAERVNRPDAYRRCDDLGRFRRDLLRTRLLLLLRTLKLRTWEDVQRYLADQRITIWDRSDGLALERLADCLELAHAHDHGAMSQLQYETLTALHLLQATSPETRQSAAEVAKRTLGEPNADRVKRPLVGLVKRGFVETKKGADGGCWLTPLGQALISTAVAPK